MGVPHDQDTYKERRLRQVISQDLDRTPKHLLGDSEELSEDTLNSRRLALERLLIAFSREKPEIGYCQGMNIVGAVLVGFLDEPRSLYALRSLLERLPKDMFSSDPDRLAKSRFALQDRVWQLLEADRPHLAKHLSDLDLDLNCFLPRWLSTLFAGVTSKPATMRLWCHVLNGNNGDAAVRLALAVVTRAEKRLLACTDASEALDELTASVTSIETQLDVDILLRREWPEIRVVQATRPKHKVQSGRSLSSWTPKLRPWKARGLMVLLLGCCYYQSNALHLRRSCPNAARSSKPRAHRSWFKWILGCCSRPRPTQHLQDRRFKWAAPVDWKYRRRSSHDDEGGGPEGGGRPHGPGSPPQLAQMLQVQPTKTRQPPLTAPERPRPRRRPPPPPPAPHEQERPGPPPAPPAKESERPSKLTKAERATMENIDGMSLEAMREFIKAQGLPVKTNVGGPSKRRKEDMRREIKETYGERLPRTSRSAVDGTFHHGLPLIRGSPLGASRLCR